jgi:hypothetical protein
MTDPMPQGLRLVWCFVVFGSFGRAWGAEPSPPGLDYRVAPGIQRCPTKEQFEALLAREVGSNPFADHPSLTLRVDLSARPDGVAGVVELSEYGEVRGKRELSSGDCSALAAALALVVGVELDPFAVARRPTEVTYTPLEPVQVESVAPREKRRGVPDLFIDTGGLAVFGVAPGTAAGAVGVGISARWASWVQAGVEGQATLPASWLNLSQVLIIGSVCATHWSLGLCGLLAVGSQTASANGTTPNGGYIAPGVRFGAEIALSPNLSLVPHGDLYFVLIEPLMVNEKDHLGNLLYTYTAPSVNGAIGLALQARIL